MITLEEQGRRLKITVGGEDEFLVRPQSSRAGAALLAGFLSMTAGFFGDAEQAEMDLIRVSLGEPVPADPDRWTDAEVAQKADADAMWDRLQEFRAEEIREVTMAAFFWQTQGGLTAARAFVDGGEDAYPKAMEVLARESGLEIFAALASTGNKTPSETENSPMDGPGTPTPPPSDALSKLPPQKRSRNQNLPPRP